MARPDTRTLDRAGRTGVGRAHGKAILLGEHAVVYGAPALAIPLPRLTVTARATRLPSPDDGVSFVMARPASAPVRLRGADGLRRLVAEFAATTGVGERPSVEVLIDCAVPHGRGLGSSAACARAAVLAFADLFDRRLGAGDVFDLVQISERVAHGRASGIDALATGATAPLLFRSGTARELRIGFDGMFVIADSGTAGSTRDAVELVRGKFERAPETRAVFVDRVADLTDAAARDLEDGRAADFGARLTDNHALLRDVGVSTDRIDALVDAALAAGALGAKISGGGLGGCAVALAADPDRARTVEHGLHDAGAARTWIVPAGRYAAHAD
ncbi:mevalonate kinase [Actinomadura pelletieri DSM 43383]|uniref:mevalonate kinase n=1 Tax=Actinomadura pelletieri DSM 43383 TaxID=1120940 RepID=A0A495QKK2_9ACTN|nr:mevalonate kinase [Actinomadura pelletieri]RKS73105.1 mevalonate kinase [Actinomadura pelletieri DSM 43383]